MKLVVNIDGDLAKMASREIARIQRATNAATRETTRRLKDGMRNEVRAGLPDGRRVATAIRSREYVDGERVTGLVYSTAGRREGGKFIDYLAAHATGAIITPKRGRYLYIPLPGAGRRGKSLRLIIGTDKVRLVPLKGNRFLIVRGTRRRDTLIGLLVPRVRIPKRLNFDSILRAENDRWVARIAAELDAAA